MGNRCQESREGRQRCSVVWAAFRGSQLPHIEVLCLSPQLPRPTASEQKETGTTGVLAAGVAAGSHRWCYGLCRTMPSLAAYSISSPVSAWQRLTQSQAPSAWTLPTGTRCPTSHVYPVVCTHAGIAEHACSPTQKFELPQTIMRLVLHMILMLLLDCMVLECELGSDIML